MNHYEDYKKAKEWHKKASIMSLFHTTMQLKISGWKISDTAKFFNVSIGLVSENLKLAKQFDNRPELLKAETRQRALDMERRKSTRYKGEEDEY